MSSQYYASQYMKRQGSYITFQTTENNLFSKTIIDPNHVNWEI